MRRLARNGFEAWSEVVAHDYEGLVAKDETSLYEAGPTRHRLKVKQRVGLLKRTAGSGGSVLVPSDDAPHRPRTVRVDPAPTAR